MTPAQATRPPSVLVVDDDPFSCELLQEMLLTLGITDVTVAGNGQEALRHLNDGATPDYLISDLYMPDMDGIDLINSLTTLPYRGGLILLSGVDVEMLSLARQIAQDQGLQVLGAVMKPLRLDQPSALLGL